MRLHTNQEAGRRCVPFRLVLVNKIFVYPLDVKTAGKGIENGAKKVAHKVEAVAKKTENVVENGAKKVVHNVEDGAKKVISKIGDLFG